MYMNTAAAGTSSEPVIDDDGHLVSYVSTAGNLIPGQSGTAGVKNVFTWLRQTDANILASGQDGSPTITGNADSDSPLLTRDSFPSFASTATNLVQGVSGTSIAYINTLVALVLSPNTIADGSRSVVVGTVSVSSLLDGQYLPPMYSLPAGEADNAFFVLASGASGETIATNFQANYVTKLSYQISVHVDIGFGDSSAILTVSVAAPAATHFRVSVPANATAGTPLSVTVTALDDIDNVATGYTGTVHFSSPVARTTLPADYTFTAADQGTHTFRCILTVASNDQLSLNDMMTSTIAGSATVTVQHAVPRSLAFAQQPPGGAVAGSPLPPVSVQVLDAYGNRVSTDNSDMVQMALAVDPGDFSGTLMVPVQNGVATFRNLVIGMGGSGYTLQATTPGLASARPPRPSA